MRWAWSKEILKEEGRRRPCSKGSRLGWRRERGLWLDSMVKFEEDVDVSMGSGRAAPDAWLGESCRAIHASSHGLAQA